MKVLVAVDGSRYTKRMLAYIAAHDEWLGPRHAYSVLTVVPPLPGRAAAALPKAVVAAHHAEQADKVLGPIRKFFDKQGIAADYLVKTGSAGEVIATQAQAGRFELVVMGSHGHGAFGGLVLGSVASRVIASCATPVLVLR